MNFVGYLYNYYLLSLILLKNVDTPHNRLRRLHRECARKYNFHLHNIKIEKVSVDS